MLHYLADIMSDATDFSWQNAKAVHAVLLCDMERGAISWEETSKLIGLGGLVPKNTHKILNLGPKIQIPAQVKSHGFAKHFKLVYVALIGTMRAMANGKDISV